MADKLVLPNNNIMANAAKIACMQDKPIKLDYWQDSLMNKVVIAVDDEKCKRLFKGEQEYTSIFTKFYSCDNAFIVLTSNSIYIVSNEIKSKKHNVDDCQED